MSAIGRRLDGREAALAGATGAAVAAIVGATTVSGPRAGIALGMLLAAALGLSIADPRRVLLAVAVVDVALQWDKNLGWNDAAAAVGAVGGLNLSATTLALGGLFVLWWWDRRPGGPGAPALGWRAAAPLIVFVGAEAFSLVAAQDRTLGGYELVMLVQCLLLFAYVAGTVRTPEDVRFLLDLLCAVLLFEALLIVAFAVTGVDAQAIGLDTRADEQITTNGSFVRVGGTVGSPNTAAGFLGLLIPLALARSLLPGDGRRIGAAAAAFGLVALLLTGSRGGWVAFGVGCAVLAAGGLYLRLLPAGRIAVAALVVAVIALPFGGWIGARLTDNDRGSASSRVSMSRLAVDMARDHPVLGIGVNNVGIRISDYAGPEFAGQFLYTIHNRYLLALAEAGPLALAALVWFLVATLLGARRAMRAADPVVAVAGLGVLAAVSAQAVHMSVDIFQSRPQTQGLWLVAGLGAALAAMAAAPVGRAR